MSLSVSEVEDEISAAWKVEAERRDAEMESGEDEGIPLEEVIRKVRALLDDDGVARR